MQCLLLTATLLLGAEVYGSDRTQDDATSTAACTSAAVLDAGLPAASRGLLQVAGEDQSLTSAKAAATERGWPSLLQGWASRLSGSVLQICYTQALDTSTIMIILVLACCLCCSGLYVGFLHRDGIQAKSSRSSSAASSSWPSAQTASQTYAGASSRAQTAPVQQRQTHDACSISWWGLSSEPTNQLARESSWLPDTILYLDFIEARPGARKADVHIRNRGGVPMFSAIIDRPAPGPILKDKDLPKDTDRAPVVVLKKDNGDGVLRCFLRQLDGGIAGLRICDMHQEGEESYIALLDIHSKRLRNKVWTLRVGRGNQVFVEYTIEGHFSKILDATVTDASGHQMATAESPSDLAADRRQSIGKCKVCIGQGMNVSVVLCALLGMGELESYRSHPPRNGT